LFGTPFKAILNSIQKRESNNLPLIISKIDY